ncbi:hypothetical protein BIY24_12255 [Halobacteriovorax marinus]|uniref:DUF2797 domain-containing protein n=1 Tax=Halobacteriovorax marinus TaxID=97084 RepID=UPI000BC2F92A|nr:DUF2797 domain-containing protein [Halobacteriovorax marinus]ATH09548.1 hypothetical protein BIY24_12255 [Halobacteriovorax marinus]
MKSTLENPVQYKLPIGDELIGMNEFIGKKIKLSFDGQINCISTGEKISKSYNQGYSFRASQKLAACDICIVKPELCHFADGTCREPEWGEANCFQPHIVYLSVSSHLKIGITRESQVPTRWIDQGASFALPILRVEDRLTSGLIEKEISKSLSDKTNWRKMLQNDVTEVDLEQERENIFEDFADILDHFEAEDLDEEVIEIEYPVNEYPTKIKSLGFDKNPVIEGVLNGIKGQYLILDCGVLNMRKHQGYFITLEA